MLRHTISFNSSWVELFVGDNLHLSVDLPNQTYCRLEAFNRRPVSYSISPQPVARTLSPGPTSTSSSLVQIGLTTALKGTSLSRVKRAMSF